MTQFNSEFLSYFFTVFDCVCIYKSCLCVCVWVLLFYIIILFIILFLVFPLVPVPTGMPTPAWTLQGPNASCTVLCQEDTMWWSSLTNRRAREKSLCIRTTGSKVHVSLTKTLQFQFNFTQLNHMLLTVNIDIFKSVCTKCREKLVSSRRCGFSCHMEGKNSQILPFGTRRCLARASNTSQTERDKLESFQWDEDFIG